MPLLKKLKNTLHWGNSSKPDIDLSPQLYEQFKAFRLPLVLIQVFILVGTLGYFLLEDYTIVQAFFQSSYTFTNTGFGALKEKEFGALAILFTTFLMLSGAGIITFSVAFIVSIVNTGTLTRLLKEKKMINNIARLRNHYVICYHNEYTIELSKQFCEAQIPFVVVDNAPNFEQEAILHKYPYYILGDPHTNISMLKARLSAARGVVTFSKNLSDNIALIVSAKLFAKELNRKPLYIISSADSEEEVQKLQKLGSDMVISAPKLMAQRISALALRPDMQNLLERFAYKNNTGLDLEEVLVPKYSWLVLKKLKEGHFREFAKVFIVGITQKDGKYFSMPDDDVVISSECKLLMIGTTSAIRDVKRIIMKQKKPQEIDYI
ncbi:potassium channel protein [Helicobacter sp. CLO-3]|uniref:potassium channel family protein n=1 Tax=unclassified Helicobacter TaxID=2593540 RepID=UPI000805B13B|nr:MULTISPECIES: NAD-binding protein [unclassified Helicobacter]OBV28523.1 potassium channel protein [Helicobacter sp. CLO-3]OHU84446.1 potassium channel protein [Helicobacter sp. CLO-3]